MMLDIKIMLSPNVDPRRRQEEADARMISEDHSAQANLSHRVINREFNAWKHHERLAMYQQSDKPNSGGE